MSPLSIIAVAFLLGVVAMSFFLGGAAVPVVLPVVLIGIAVVGYLDFNRRRKQAKQVHDFREQAKTKKPDFSQRDQETLVSE